MKRKSEMQITLLMSIIVLTSLLVSSSSSSLATNATNVLDNSSPVAAPVNNPPVAADISAITYENNPILIDVLAHCSDPDEDPLTVVSVSTPQHGIATIEDVYHYISHGVINYRPDLNYFGLDYFTYTISDGKATATATVTVNCVSISTINNFIQGLNDDAFYPPPNQRKLAFSNALNKIDTMIKDEDYQNAINKLENIRAKADGSLGGNPKDDLITDPKAQEQICHMIDELIVALRDMLYDEPPTVPLPRGYTG